MAFTERYHCDVCGVTKNADDHDWWLAWVETISPTPNAPAQQALRVTQWNVLLSHSAEAIHLCGARCAQTELDRWMTPLRESLHMAAEPPPGAK